MLVLSTQAPAPLQGLCSLTEAAGLILSSGSGWGICYLPCRKNSCWFSAFPKGICGEKRGIEKVSSAVGCPAKLSFPSFIYIYIYILVELFFSFSFLFEIFCGVSFSTTAGLLFLIKNKPDFPLCCSFSKYCLDRDFLFRLCNGILVENSILQLQQQKGPRFLLQLLPSWWMRRPSRCDGASNLPSQQGCGGSATSPGTGPVSSPPYQHHTNWGQQGSECSAMMEPSRLFSLLAGEPCIAQGAEQEPAAAGSRVAELKQRQALAYEL